MRWRRVFRSDTLHRLERGSAERLEAELGIRTAIDLRAYDEIERAGIGHLRDVDVTYVHLPTADLALHAGRVRAAWAGATASEMYLRMLENAAPRFGQALRVLAEPAAQPAVFFCSAGKDRTGVLAALLLAILGVPDAEIVADYALTGEVVPVIIERFRRDFPTADETFAHLPKDLAAAPAHAMEGLLVGLRERYGSVDACAEAMGVGAAARTSLRESLLAPGS